MKIYLDNASTTKPCYEAVKAINIGLSEIYGNPSSLHSVGLNAELKINEARNILADALSCESDSIYFTSGATESNNLAIRGTVKTYGKRKRRIVTTTVEHSSIEKTFDELEKDGFEVVRISPQKNGEYTSESIINAVDENTCLVSMMLVNNENGYILPVGKAFKVIKKRFPDVITHTDCVQGFMKIPFKVSELNADMISISAHKIYGAKGAGALYLKKGVRLLPIITGGKQEKGIRAGTESVPLIMGFGAAVNTLKNNISENYSNAERLKQYFVEKLSALEDVTVNSKENCSPYIINVSILGIRSETMLHFLESKDIFVSSGSACSKGAKSGVLSEFGLSNQQSDSALRISFSNDTNTSEIDQLISAIKLGQENIFRKK